MGATARATRRTRRSARGDDDDDEIARDVAGDDGCKTPERRAKTTDEDVRVRARHAQSSFPAQIDVMILNRRRAREGGATTDRAMRRGLTKITRRSVRVAGHRVARVAGILQFLCIQFEPDRDVARAVERREHDALRLVRGRAIAGSSVL
jgi:hypothetical protein